MTKKKAKKKNSKQAQTEYQAMESAAGMCLDDLEDCEDPVPPGNYMFKIRSCKVVPIKDQSVAPGCLIRYNAELLDDDDGSVDEKYVGATIFGQVCVPDKTRNKPFTKVCFKRFVNALGVEVDGTMDLAEAAIVIAAEAVGQTFYAQLKTVPAYNDPNREQNDFGTFYPEVPSTLGPM